MIDYLSIDPTKAREHAINSNIDELDVSNWHLFKADAQWAFFERLRREDPVHYHSDSRYGPYWSITRHDHIKEIDTDHHRFSSEKNITIVDSGTDGNSSSFIAMDPPKHDQQRKVVAPVVGPRNLGEMESLIRSRVVSILDSLPIDEEFNWVERVSIELTTQMLATLFDFPFEQRRKLTFWSDISTLGPKTGLVDSWEDVSRELQDCLAVFLDLFEQRADQDMKAST